MSFIFHLIVIFSVLHYGVSVKSVKSDKTDKSDKSVDEKTLEQWRKDNAKNYDAFSSILHSRIKEGFSDPARIEWLTKTDIILAMDREVYLSFNFELPLVIPENLDQIVAELTSNKKNWGLKKSHIDTLNTLKKHTVTLKKISDSLDDKEFLHHKNYKSLGDFFLLLNSTTAYNYKEIEQVTQLLDDEYKKIASMHKQILKKSHALRDCIDNKNVLETAVEIFALKKQIHEMVLGTNFEEHVISAELGPKIDELDGYVKKFGEFLKDKSVTQFTGIDKLVDTMEKSLTNLSNGFMKTLKNDPPSPTSSTISRSTTGSSNSGSQTNSSKTEKHRWMDKDQKTLNVRRYENTEQYKIYVNIIVKNTVGGIDDELTRADLFTLHDILSMSHEIFHSFNIKISFLISDVLENLNQRKLNDHETKVIKSIMRYSEKVRELAEFLDDTESRHYARYKNGDLFYEALKARLQEKNPRRFTGENVRKLQTVLDRTIADMRLQREMIMSKTHKLKHASEALLLCIQNAVSKNKKLVFSIHKTLLAQLEPLIKKLNASFTDNSDVTEFLEVDANIRELEASENELVAVLDNLVK